MLFLSSSDEGVVSQSTEWRSGEWRSDGWSASCTQTHKCQRGYAGWRLFQDWHCVQVTDYLIISGNMPLCNQVTSVVTDKFLTKFASGSWPGRDGCGSKAGHGKVRLILTRQQKQCSQLGCPHGLETPWKYLGKKFQDLESARKHNMALKVSNLL